MWKQFQSCIEMSTSHLVCITLHCRWPVRSLLLLRQQVWVHDVWPRTATSRAEPLALWFVCQTDTIKMEPFYCTLLVVAAYHLSIGHLNDHITDSLTYCYINSFKTCITVHTSTIIHRTYKVGMLTSLDRDKSRKRFSGSRKIFLDEKFLDPKFGLEQMLALKCLRTRRDVFVLCRRLVSDYTSRPAPYL